MVNLFLHETTCLKSQKSAYHQAFPVISSSLCDNLFP